MTGLTGILRFGSFREFVDRTVAILRLKPFETSTPGGRSRERYRRATLSGLSGVGAHGLTVLITVISVPIALEKLGVDPAVASSVFVTTFTDVAGFGLLLGLAAATLL